MQNIQVQRFHCRKFRFRLRLRLIQRQYYLAHQKLRSYIQLQLHPVQRRLNCWQLLLIDYLQLMLKRRRLPRHYHQLPSRQHQIVQSYYQHQEQTKFQ